MYNIYVNALDAGILSQYSWSHEAERLGKIGEKEMNKNFKYNGPYIVTTRGFRVISGHAEKKTAMNKAAFGIGRTVWEIRPDGKGYDAIHGYHA